MQENYFTKETLKAALEAKGITTNAQAQPVIDAMVKKGAIIQGYNEPKQEQGTLAKIGSSLIQAPQRLGQGILNTVAPAVNAVGSTLGATGNIVPENQATTKDIFGGTSDALGYKDGEKLQGTELAKDVAGNVLQNAALLVPGTAELKGASLGTKVVKGAITGAKAGALQGAGTGLQDQKDTIGVLENTALGAGAGAVLGGAVPLVPEAVKLAGTGVKKGAEALSKVAEKVTPTSESIMQRVARIPKGEQVKFEKITGKSVGQFLDETGNYGTPDKIIEKLYNDFTKSKQTADDALETLQGTYRADVVKTALNELEGKVERTSSIGAPDIDLSRVRELAIKERQQGLTMSEINEVKRLYEKRVRLGYLKEQNVDAIDKATNIDSSLREWQMKEAKNAGLTNLDEINKFTQANKQLMDALGKETAGSAGNNALGLTDAILVAGGSPESIASLVTKKVFSDKGVQSYVAKKLSKVPVKTNVPVAKFKEKLQLPAPKSGQTKVQIEVPIELLSKSDSAIEKELVKNFGKKYTKAQIFEMANRLKELPAPKSGQTKVQIEVPINVKPTKDIDISKGFKTSKNSKQ